MVEKVQHTGKLNTAALTPELIRLLSALQVAGSCHRCEACQSCQSCQSCQRAVTSEGEETARTVIYEMIQDALTPKTGAG
jgi:glycine/D-amino acid oxidase-like deaminating enzyme